jgi:hypothetical protein
MLWTFRCYSNVSSKTCACAPCFEVALATGPAAGISANNLACSGACKHALLEDTGLNVSAFFTVRHRHGSGPIHVSVAIKLKSMNNFVHAGFVPMMAPFLLP